jgi:hypothetical protein
MEGRRLRLRPRRQTAAEVRFRTPPSAASVCAFENHTSRWMRKMKSRHRSLCADDMHPKTSEVYIDAPHAVTRVCTISGTHKYVCVHKYSM